MRHSSAGLVWLWLAACDAAPAEVLFTDAAVGSDAGSVPPQRSAAAAQTPLSVSIQVERHELRCGDCTDLSVQVSGGSAPYTIVWSEAGLLGPGPHRVCPGAAVTYAVAVVDARSVPMLASATLTCSPAADASTAGASVPAPPAGVCVGKSAADPGTTCQMDAVGLPIARSIGLTQPMLPGVAHSAQLMLQGLEATIANGLSFRLYGARTPCEPEQLLGTFAVSAAVSGYASCFVPEQAYAYLIGVSEVSALGLAVLDRMTVCSAGCKAAGE